MKIEEQLIYPPLGGFVDRETREQLRYDWLELILDLTKKSEPGKWNEKYGVMVFKANYGYHSIMKKIVDDYVKSVRINDPKIIVMEEVDDNKVKSWVVGNPDNIKSMVNDELKAQ